MSTAGSTGQCGSRHDPCASKVRQRKLLFFKFSCARSGAQTALSFLHVPLSFSCKEICTSWQFMSQPN